MQKYVSRVCARSDIGAGRQLEGDSIVGEDKQGWILFFSFFFNKDPEILKEGG